MFPAAIAVDEATIHAFCEKWNVVELDLFGSALRSDFNTDSDIDLLVVYADDAHPTLFDEGEMLNELEAIFQRPVHFMTKRSVERSKNNIRRDAILASATPIYVKST